MVVLGESGSQTLLTGAKPLMASGSPLTEPPVPSIFIRGFINSEVLTQDVAATCDVTGLLSSVHKQTSLIAVSTGLQRRDSGISTQDRSLANDTVGLTQSSAWQIYKASNTAMHSIL